MTDGSGSSPSSARRSTPSPEPPAHTMHECADPACRLRLPVPAGHAEAGRCPRCGSTTTATDPVPNPPPAHPFPDPAADGPPGPRVAGLLDNVRSVLNVGAMFRTADAAGLVHLHLCGITAPGDHDGLRKTALGAQHVVPWTHHRHGPDAVDALAADGWDVWALEARPGARPLIPVSGGTRPDRVVVVVGHEVAGIDPAILARADRVVGLPMHGMKRSLNVSTAFGIAVYALRSAT